MKQKIKIAIMASVLFASLAVCLIMVEGCASRVVLSPATPATTNEVTGVVTPGTAAVTTNVPNLTAGKIIQYGNSALPFIPAPYGDLLALALAATAGITTILAKKANIKATQSDDVVATIVKGVETAGAASAAVKQSIANTALLRGTSDAVQAAVDKHVA